MTRLPPGWASTTIGEVADYVQRGRGPTYAPQSTLPVINQKCIRWHGVDPEHLKFIDESTRSQWAVERHLKQGDVLWNSTGTGTLGRAAVFEGLAGFDSVVVDSHVTIVRSTKVEPRFIYYWIRSPVVQGRLEEMQAGSTNQVELPRGEVIATKLPLAPLNEQRRIVAKLDAIFEQTRAAKARLERLPTLLDKLKRSTLAAAFRGDLTADWRDANSDGEPGRVLLDRIRAERRERREANSRPKGKHPTNAKYDEAEQVERTNLPGLPIGWVWCRLDELISSSLYGPRFGVDDYAARGVPTIRTTDLGHDGRIHLKDPPLIAEHAANLEEWGLQDGDLLVTRTGATIGKAAVYSSDIGPALPSAYLIRFRPVLPSLGRWLHLFLISPRGQMLLGTGATATAQPNVNARTISAFWLPVPPLREQARILAAVDAALELADSLGHRIERCAVAASSIERAALAKAFRGELIEQDPNDEAASELLARIRAAVADGEPSPARTRTPRAGSAKAQTMSTSAANATATRERGKSRTSQARPR